MPKALGADDLDAIANYWRTLAGTAGRIVAHLVSNYTAGDSYATVLANSLGSVALATADVVAGAGASSARTITIASKDFALTAGHAGTTLHYVLVDTVSSLVRAATTATSDVTPLVSGATWTSGTVVITLPQPT
jgi:hypothetical protein